MKKLLLLPLLVLIPLLANAQEKFFHNLKGMEDSEGVTHLFYRIYDYKVIDCLNSEGETMHSVNPHSNDVFHLNTQTSSDSLKFRDYYEPGCFGNNEFKSIRSYNFYNNNPDDWLAETQQWDCTWGIADKHGDFMHLYLPCTAVKRKAYAENERNQEGSFFLSPNSDSLYIKWVNEVTIPLGSSPETWPSFEEDGEYYGRFEHFVDSVKIPYTLIAIHPFTDSLYYATDNAGKLYISEYYSSDFTLADSSSHYSELFFDSDNTHIYSLSNDSSLLVSDNLGRIDSWTAKNLPFSSRFIENDRGISGNIYSADTTHIYVSHDYGNTFELYFETEHEITGLYKKPNSEILYVLTIEELFKFENGVKSSLKTLPVSNEMESNSQPIEIMLFQNYPNPFNPSTIISYQLPVSGLVKLDVFDMLGRKVATLIDGRTPAGLHEVTFNAQGLSSGMYFYRLKANGMTETKRFTIIK
ncbi:MAG: T9SS type A sorting domain-containing protein [Balneolaceae bacterium]